MRIKYACAELQLFLVRGGRVSNPAAAEGTDSCYSHH